VSDEHFMQLALDAARGAASQGDVPVGCVVVRNNEVVTIAANAREAHHDPTAHAEVLALRAAGVAAGTWRLDDATVYVTLEPCVMCAGALLNARVARVVIGALDEKAGAVGSRYHVLADPRLLHEVPVTYDVCGEECATVLREFFQERRP
jgi:tRNA(adenine34) deaminase